MNRFAPLSPAVAFFAIASVLAPVLTPAAFATPAQPVPIPEDHSTAPQIQLSGVGVATLDASRKSENGSDGAKAAVNFSDSALLVGAAQRLADGRGVGSAGLGWLTLDETNRGTGAQLFLHQGFVDYQSESFEAVVGRTDNPTAHFVDFPTLRGDDLLTLTNPTDPFSNGENAEEHRYANVASVTLNQGLRTFENFHVQHLVNSAGIGSPNGLNAFGFSFQYLAPPGMEAFSRMPSWGFGYEHFALASNTSSGLHQVYFGGVLNLNESVTNRWDLRLQDIAGFGSRLRSFASENDSFQADANTVSASLRYLASPFGRLGYQLSLTAAYQTYFDVDEARSFGAALTGVKRLGQGFDLVAQYQGQWRDRALADVQSNRMPYEQTLEVGFIFSFDATFNEHLAPRRTLLNQEHQYVPN